MVFPKSYLDLAKDVDCGPRAQGLIQPSFVLIYLEASKIRMFAFLKMLKGFDIVSNVEQTQHNLCNI